MSDRLTVEDLRARLGGGTTSLAEADPAPPETKPDLVGSTLAAYRAKPIKGGFRRGANAAQMAAPSEAPRHRSNKYGGTCPLCHQRVEAGEGRLDKQGDEWITSHLTCPAPIQSTDPVEQASAVEVPTASTATVTQATIKAVTGQVYTGIHPGRYTIQTADGHRTFRVKVQPTEETFAPGQTLLEYLTGPDNTKDYTTIAFLRGTRPAFWSRFKEPQFAELREQALEFLADPDGDDVVKAVACIRCNADLTVYESVVAGMGPTCRNKGW